MLILKAQGNEMSNRDWVVEPPIVLCDFINCLTIIDTLSRQYGCRLTTNKPPSFKNISSRTELIFIGFELETNLNEQKQNFVTTVQQFLEITDSNTT